MSVLCETLGVSRSAYYAWRQDESSTREREDNRLSPMIRSIFREHKRRYGARRIAKELSARSAVCSRRRVGRLMHQMGLVAIHNRGPSSRARPTADTRSVTARTE